MDKMAVQHGQTKRIIILGLLLVINFFLFYWPGFPVSLNDIKGDLPLNRIPDLHLRYSPEQVYDFLTKIGPDGRQAFRMMHLSVDLTFPIVYSLFFFLLLKNLTQKTISSPGFIPIFAILAGTVDLAENFLLNYLATQYPIFLPNLTILVEIITILKFSFLTICIFLSVYFGLKSARMRLRRSSFL